MIAKQFRDLKFGDKFYFERQIPNSLFSFTQNQLDIIRNITMANILCRNLDLKIIQKYAFFTANNYFNPLLNCNDLSNINLTEWQEVFFAKNYTVIIFNYIFIVKIFLF